MNLSKYFKLSNPLKVMILNQGFGANETPFYKTLGMKGHNGWDLKAKKGTVAMACFSGTAVVVGTDLTGGKEIRIRSEEKIVGGKRYRLEAVYYHLDSFKCKVGAKVEPGLVIGLTGNSGKYTTGAHLHFGLKLEWSDSANGEWLKDRTNGYFGAIDPAPFLPHEFPVDGRYGKLRSIKGEILVRFNPFVTRKLKRAPTKRELNALVYGNWDIEAILRPEMFAAWVVKVK